MLLPLTSPVWRGFRHCYGSAGDVPPLLRRLAEDPRPKPDWQDEPWFTLWSALCHQGDVYGASYAAVPHIVEIGIAACGPIDQSFFLLPASVEVARLNGHGPVVPDSIAPGYRRALDRLHDCAFAHAADAWDGSTTQSIAAALAASKGHVALAQALIDLNDDMIARMVAGDWDG